MFGRSAVTLIVVSSVPSFRFASAVVVWPICTVTPLHPTRLEPRHLGADGIDARRQVEEPIVAPRVGDHRPGAHEGFPRDLDGDAGQGLSRAVDDGSPQRPRRDLAGERAGEGDDHESENRQERFRLLRIHDASSLLTWMMEMTGYERAGQGVRRGGRSVLRKRIRWMTRRYLAHLAHLMLKRLRFANRLEQSIVFIIYKKNPLSSLFWDPFRNAN